MRVTKLNPIFYVLLYFSPSLCPSQNKVNSYLLDVNVAEKQVYSNHLKLGGTNDKGDEIAVNNYYISKNGKPFIPITGEFHFSRYPRDYWEESIQKIKAGGVNIIATYIFWNMHEEDEGTFNWSGNRDVREFVKLCAKHDMQVIVRIGPFGHGEIRNGGIPDWLMGKPLTIRSNDPKYLAYVEKLYNEIGKQLEGLLFKDGAPIIGTQLENEYQHSAAPWGLAYPGQPYDYTSAERDKALTQFGVGVSEEVNPYAELGNEHMKVLKTLAEKAGIITPIYTATGWGNGAIIKNETLPVTAAYAYATWVKPGLSSFYLYKDLHKEPDYSPVRYESINYPVFAAELGGGIMATYGRRPIVPPNSLDAMINRCLGSGANGIGYYMYHGGSTPRGKYYYFNDEVGGSTKISYDFQAPIGEFGQVRPAFNRLKLLHQFINNFGHQLAPMRTVLPSSNLNDKPQDVNKLRYAVRIKNNSGFLFLNNFQDDTIVQPKENIRIKLKLENEEIYIGEEVGFNLPAEENLILPFNFKMGETLLKYATGQLIDSFTWEDVNHYIFFTLSGNSAQFLLENTADTAVRSDHQIKIEKINNRTFIETPMDKVVEFNINSKGSKAKILVIPKKLAMKLSLVEINGQKHFIFSDALMLSEKDGAEIHIKGKKDFEMKVYPKISQTPKLNVGKITENRSAQIFSEFKIILPAYNSAIKVDKFGKNKFRFEFQKNWPLYINDIYVNIDYIGDTAMGFIDGELVADEFFKGMLWQIGLKRFADEKTMKTFNFFIRPLYEEAPFLIDLPFLEKADPKLEIREIDVILEYKAQISF